MTREQALDESPAWLMALLAAERRARAEDALLYGSTHYAATAATVSESGVRVWRKWSRSLEEQANG